MAGTTRRDLGHELMKWRLVSHSAAFFVIWFGLFFAMGQERLTESFNEGWRFHQGDQPAARMERFKDDAWRRVTVPHDWSIEGEFHEANLSGRGGAYLPTGVGWYRKTFTLPASASNRCVRVEFDGVMANSSMWINGQSLGGRPSGYVSFQYDLTPHLVFGGTNVLAVRVDTSRQPASRWYAGSGIHRPVRLIVTDPVHIEPWGTFVTTPAVSEREATVRVQTSVTNQSTTDREIAVETTLQDPSGKTVGVVRASKQMIAAGASAVIEAETAVKQPERWSIETPQLYRAVSRVMEQGTVLDDDTVNFGVREFRFEADTGFWLNGKNFKIKGVCLHHDGGPVGAAVPMGVWERRLEKLREIGVNAIRAVHNPAAPEFLDLCDRMGFLVVEDLYDAWYTAKSSARFGGQVFFKEWGETDARDTARRDRNHPSLILYNAGNEIRDSAHPEVAKETFSALRDAVRSADTNRPVTMSLFRPNDSKDYENGLADLLDVVGQNYREQELLEAHEKKPTRRIISLENGHERRTWLAVANNAALAGQFVWTGVDYLGEANWPSVIWTESLVDITGELRPRGYQRQSWWSDQPMVRMVRRETSRVRAGREEWGSNWTPLEPVDGRDEQVDVYSNCEEVELFLNGESLEKRTKPDDYAPRTWRIPFQIGTLVAVGSNGGTSVATNELRTAGTPTKLHLEVNRSEITTGWNDVAHLTVSVLDDNGVECPWADHKIAFRVKGAGGLVGVINANPCNHEPFQSRFSTLFQGRCLALLKADGTGEIVVSVSAEGLETASIHIEAKIGR